MGGLEALWLGIVQGLTEFLPVSSSGHLAIFQEIFGVNGDGLVFEVAVHVATLAAIVAFYRGRIASLIAGAARGDVAAWRYGLKLAIGTLPIVAFALFARDWIEAQFSAPHVVGVCLLITSAILLSTRFTLPRATGREPSFRAALLIGCAQAFAVLPGISRSGSTVAAALALGVAPAVAAEFSFLLGVVAITGAAVLLLSDASIGGNGILIPIALGGAAALLSGIAAIWLFLRLLERKRFHSFAYYTGALGVAYLAYLTLR